MTNVRNNPKRTQRTQVVTQEEFTKALDKANEIENEFMRLRARALLCVLRLTGKRRGEVAPLEVSSFKINEDYLEITFVLEKKRRKQVLTKTSTKSIPLTDPYTKPIIEYLEYLEQMNPNIRYFLPRIHNRLGHTSIMVNEHIGGRQVFNIVRQCSSTIWPHLFRETAAADIIRKDPSIIGAFKVQRRLDLESYTTAFNYLRRYGTDIIERENPRVKDIEN